jgi:hypothetical protein
LGSGLGALWQAMGLPTEPRTLTVEQIAELNRKLADMRHDINGELGVIVAAVELIRRKPESLERVLASLSEQPARIGESLKKFSLECEEALGITRP